MLVLFAVGNDGYLSTTGNVGHPSTAKNIISVGASQTTNENFRESEKWRQRGFGEYSLTNLVGECSYEMIRSYEDCCDDQFGCCLSSAEWCHTRNDLKSYCCPPNIAERKYGGEFANHFHEMNMANFSSRGPAMGNRISPLVVAPGNDVISARGKLAPGGSHCSEDYLKDGARGSAALISYGGTSMATPIVAGIAALVRQYFVEGWYPTGAKVVENEMPNVSGNLIRAVLVHSAKSMTGEVDINGKLQYENLPEVVPNNYYGFGLIQIGETLKFEEDGIPEYLFWVVDRETVSSGESKLFSFRKIADSAQGDELIVTMSYYDPPASAFSVEVLINNLNLLVTVNGNVHHWGNSVENGDPSNCVEKVVVKNLKAGDDIIVQITGEYVQSGEQKFAVVVTDSNIEYAGPEEIGSALLRRQVCLYVMMVVVFILVFF